MPIHTAQVDFVRALVLSVQGLDLRRGNHDLLRALASPLSYLAEGVQGGTLRVNASLSPSIRDVW